MTLRRCPLLAALLICWAGIAFAQTEWTLDPGEPVLEPAAEGSWDHGLRFIEAVIEVDGVYHMFYRGQREGAGWIGPFAVGHATSTDGLSWQLDPANPVLSPGVEDEWDRDSIRGAAVIHDGSQFRMWYAATTPDEYGLDVVWHGIGCATSTDGSTWSKSAENPIIRPGSEGTFAVPQTVLYDGESYHMWYTASALFWTDGGHPAWSEDGITWGGFTFVEAARQPTREMSVVLDGSRYIMMRSSWGYFPSLLGAASPDGHTWTDFARQPQYFWAGSPAMLVDEGVFEMWYSSIDGVYRATSTCCATTYTWFIAAAASGPGASGSFYRTEVEVNNAGEETAEYRFAWFPRGRDNSEWIRSAMFQLEPGVSVRYADVLYDVFGLGPGSFGALAVEATTNDLLAAARIHTSVDPSAGGYGQSIPTLRIDDFEAGMLHGAPRILFGNESADARFNVTCFNASEVPRVQEFRLFDSDGNSRGFHRVRLEPWGSHQINRIFEDQRPVHGYVDVDRYLPLFCFGSLLDNTTNDPTTIWPR